MTNRQQAFLALKTEDSQYLSKVLKPNERDPQKTKICIIIILTLIPY